MASVSYCHQTMSTFWRRWIQRRLLQSSRCFQDTIAFFFVSFFFFFSIKEPCLPLFIKDYAAHAGLWCMYLSKDRVTSCGISWAQRACGGLTRRGYAVCREGSHRGREGGVSAKLTHIFYFFISITVQHIGSNVLYKTHPYYCLTGYYANSKYI